eukprot:TRINITY_DN680_c1_g1_i1.p1 TRINITY_DN680_c1_g1~~TRINITY_DN680_c1_g1_i1.p1  ORF type:complete len:422 (+),score=113.17 TRINITY_DN680_c1_g1_i1:89-1267(+)
MTSTVLSNQWRPEWVLDASAAECHSCCRPFRVFRRRHHCRHCGHIHCNSCSSRRVWLPAVMAYRAPQRVCDKCHARLTQPLHRSFDVSLPRMPKLSLHSPSSADAVTPKEEVVGQGQPPTLALMRRVDGMRTPPTTPRMASALALSSFCDRADTLVESSEIAGVQTAECAARSLIQATWQDAVSDSQRDLTRALVRESSSQTDGSRRARGSEMERRRSSLSSCPAQLAGCAEIGIELQDPAKPGDQTVRAAAVTGDAAAAGLRAGQTITSCNGRLLSSRRQFAAMCATAASTPGGVLTLSIQGSQNVRIVSGCGRRRSSSTSRSLRRRSPSAGRRSSSSSRKHAAVAAATSPPPAKHFPTSPSRSSANTALSRLTSRCGPTSPATTFGSVAE